jgi:hypothetical protein
VIPRAKTRSLQERLDAKTLKGGPDDCWLWQGSKKTKQGHGQIMMLLPQGSKMIGAHVAAYILAHGPVPEGHEVRHRCHKPSCVNPAHLISGTHRENMQDSIRDGRMHVPRTRGEHCYQAKVTWEQVCEIRANPDRLTQTQLGERYGLRQSSIWNIIHYKSWKTPGHPSRVEPLRLETS